MGLVLHDFVKMENATEVFISDDEIVVLGNPDEEVNEEHNCDYMGCGSLDHVIFRAKLVDLSVRIG